MRRTVARVKHIKNLKTFTGYVQLKLSSFWLSDYSLQWIKMEKMITTLNTKIGETIKRRIYITMRENMYMSVNKLIVLLQKNRVMIKEQP